MSFMRFLLCFLGWVEYFYFVVLRIISFFVYDVLDEKFYKILEEEWGLWLCVRFKLSIIVIISGNNS